MSLVQELREMWQERAEQGPEAAPAGAAPAPSALPCRNSNNSPTPRGERGYKFKRSGVRIQGPVGMAQAQTLTCTEAGEGVDGEGRAWKRDEDGQWERMMGGLSAPERRQAFALRHNVEAFARHYKRECCGFLTLTAPSRNMTPKEFGVIFDDMRKHGLSWMLSYVRVLEPQKRGAPHYHLLVATPFDLEPDAFDWEALFGAAEARKRGDLETARALTRRYAEKAPKALRDVWAELRRICKRHGLGRSEFLPFRKGGGAVANYVGKYLEGGLAFKKDEWKGARRVEYDRKASRQWKACAASFGWASSGAKTWRGRVGEYARAIGARDMEDMKRLQGPRWAYHLRESIMLLDEISWRQLLAYSVHEYGGEMPPKPRLQLGKEVIDWWPGAEDVLKNWEFFKD